MRVNRARWKAIFREASRLYIPIIDVYSNGRLDRRLFLYCVGSMQRACRGDVEGLINLRLLSYRLFGEEE